VSSDLQIVNQEEEYEEQLPMLGVLDVRDITNQEGSGKIMVLGDSNCVE